MHRRISATRTRAVSQKTENGVPPRDHGRWLGLSESWLYNSQDWRRPPAAPRRPRRSGEGIVRRLQRDAGHVWVAADVRRPRRRRLEVEEHRGRLDGDVQSREGSIMSDLMGTMRAIVQDSYGADVWRLAEIPPPEI